ncbi:hypothetical protein [Nonomuraea roseola]|uniref:Uncharacterized protein n=1 Tax=Nonomuraea roseola TaxID=46179 RepID=A0ABV5PTQ5_9ACTN
MTAIFRRLPPTPPETTSGRRTALSITGRMLVTGAAGGAFTGVITAQVFLISALPGAEHVDRLAFLAGLAQISLVGGVVGLFAGTLLAVPALMVLLPLATWAARRRWRARTAGAAACLLPVAALNAAGVIATEARDGLLWPLPALAVPVFAMAIAIGLWRGPGLLRYRTARQAHR